MMQRIRWFLLLLGIVVVLALSLTNSELTPIKIPFTGTWELPLSVLLLATSGVSFVFGSIMTGWMLRSRRKTPAPKQREVDSTSSSTKPASTL